MEEHRPSPGRRTTRDSDREGLALYFSNPMLRASRLVRAATPARGYATAADSFASKTTVFESVKPTASVTFLLKAGARHEQKPGAAHVLSNFAFTVSVFRLDVGGNIWVDILAGIWMGSW